MSILFFVPNLRLIADKPALKGSRAGAASGGRGRGPGHPAASAQSLQLDMAPGNSVSGTSCAGHPVPLWAWEKGSNQQDLESKERDPPLYEVSPAAFPSSPWMSFKQKLPCQVTAQE